MPWAAHGDGAPSSERRTYGDTERKRVATAARARARVQRGKERDGKLRVWRGNGKGETGTGVRGGWSRSRDLQTINPNAHENDRAALRSVPLYTKSLFHKLRVLRVASMASEGQGRAKMGLEVTAGGFDPVTSNKQVPAHLITDSPPREARSYFPNPCYMKVGFARKASRRHKRGKLSKQRATQTTPRGERRHNSHNH